MTGLLVTVTGWTIPALESTPWPDVLDLLDYWADYPPLHLMVRGYLGIKDKKDERVSPQEFMNMFQATK